MTESCLYYIECDVTRYCMVDSFKRESFCYVCGLRVTHNCHSFLLEIVLLLYAARYVLITPS